MFFTINLKFKLLQLTLYTAAESSMEIALSWRVGLSTEKFQQHFVNEESSTERRSVNHQVQQIFSTVMSRPESVMIRQEYKGLL